MSSPKPLVVTGVMTEYGEVEMTADDLALADGSVDYTNVPGYSDLRREHDFAKAEGRKPTPLPAHLRWFRRTNRDGTPTNARTVVGLNAGYRAVTRKDLGQSWFTEMPAAAFELPDGTIGSADGQLMVLDAKSAAKRSFAKQVRMLEQNVGSQQAALTAAGANLPGSEPEITTSLGPARLGNEA